MLIFATLIWMMIIIVRMISHQVVDAQGSPLCIGGQPSQFESLLVTTVILHPSSLRFLRFFLPSLFESYFACVSCWQEDSETTLVRRQERDQKERRSSSIFPSHYSDLETERKEGYFNAKLSISKIS